MRPLDEIQADERPHVAAADRFSARQKVLFTAVSEPSPRGCAEVELLVRSLRAFGGRQSDADVRVYFVGEVPDVARERLGRLGADLWVSHRFHEDCPHANKLWMFREADGYDYLLGLDTDTLVVGDVTPQVFGESVAGRPTAGDHCGHDGWRTILDAFDLDVPADRYTSCLTREEMLVPYFNSGALLVHADLLGVLHKSWSDWVLRVLEARPRLTVLQEQWFYTDQIALTLALVEQGLPRRSLPLSMNMQYHAAHHALAPDQVDPLVAHHHHRFTHEGLAYGTHSGFNDAVDRVNGKIELAPVLDAYGIESVDDRSMEGGPR